jgi:FkbM family methyltransferase
MRRIVKSLVKWGLAKTPFRLIRGPQNRFQAIEDCLWHLKGLGYAPRMIIDGGAHLGDFSILACRVFPNADIHMIEPQPACQGALMALETAHRFKLHPFALVSSEQVGKPVVLAASSEPSTGAYIVPAADRVPENILVETSTLDRLLVSAVKPGDRVLLKLDLQGYELSALRGAVGMLKSVEVLLTEVSFFAQAYEPSIAELTAFLDEHEFDLYDVAALSARMRDNRLKQGDLIFVKRNSSLASDKSWA